MLFAHLDDLAAKWREDVAADVVDATAHDELNRIPVLEVASDDRLNNVNSLDI